MKVKAELRSPHQQGHHWWPTVPQPQVPGGELPLLLPDRQGWLAGGESVCRGPHVEDCHTAGMLLNYLLISQEPLGLGDAGHELPAGIRLPR